MLSIDHGTIARHDQLVVDFSDCCYIDPEGPRWLAPVKAAQVQS